MTDPLPTSLVASRGIARLLRVDIDPAPPLFRAPLLVVPSPIARWRHLDPHSGPSLLRSLSSARIPTYCLDWGAPIDQDRDLTWDDLVGRVGWAREQVARDNGHHVVGLLGFSLGGTLSVISAALDNNSVGCLIDLSGPVDFEKAGVFAWLSDERWFNPAVPAAMFRCTPPWMMRATLALHRAGPTRPWLDCFGPAIEAASPPMHELCETWAQEHVPLPPRAFQAYVRELIQHNDLMQGRHHVDGVRIDLSKITCPVLAIGARRDKICPHRAVTALLEATRSADASELLVAGGHLGSIVGRRADRGLHDPIVRWLLARLDNLEPTPPSSTSRPPAPHVCPDQERSHERER